MFRALGLHRSEGLPLRDMLSLGAWRMGLGCPGNILPSPSSPSPSPSTLGLSFQIGLIEGEFEGAKPPQQPSTLGLSFQIGLIEGGFGGAPPTAFNSWVVLPDWEHLPKMSIVRFCHERAQIKRWGAVRHVIVSGISMRVFFIFIFP